MNDLKQKTIKKEIVIKGIGLHSGKLVNLAIKPAKPNSGIIFKRTDINNNNLIMPGMYNVSKAFF